jgi:hypothetical protein
MSISPSSLNCLYAPNEVDTDEKKQDYFLNDLNDGLAYSLEARDFDNFQRMVNNALVLKNHVLLHLQLGCVLTSSAAILAEAARQGFSTLQRQVIQRPNNSQTPAARNQNAQRIQVASDLLQAERRCFACGEKGHFTN